MRATRSDHIAAGATLAVLALLALVHGPPPDRSPPPVPVHTRDRGDDPAAFYFSPTLGLYVPPRWIEGGTAEWWDMGHDI